MDLFAAFLGAIRKPCPDDLRRNSSLCLLIFWGLLISRFANALDVRLIDRAQEELDQAFRIRTGLGFRAGIASWPAEGILTEDQIASADPARGTSRRKSRRSRMHFRIFSAVESRGYER